MRARITVTLKAGVLDPQGQAISGSLRGLGFESLKDVRQGKIFDVELNATEVDDAHSQLQAMCEKLLANTVIENYAIEIIR